MLAGPPGELAHKREADLVLALSSGRPEIFVNRRTQLSRVSSLSRAPFPENIETLGSNFAGPDRRHGRGC